MLRASRCSDGSCTAFSLSHCVHSYTTGSPGSNSPISCSRTNSASDGSSEMPCNLYEGGQRAGYPCENTTRREIDGNGDAGDDHGP